MTNQNLTVEMRVLRIGAVIDRVRDVIMPEKNKAINIWPRFRTQDFGMSVAHWTVQGTSILHCIEQVEQAILVEYNSFFHTELTDFEVLSELLEDRDSAQLREELEDKIKSLSNELELANKQLMRIRKRDSLVNRRNRKSNEKES